MMYGKCCDKCVHKPTSTGPSVCDSCVGSNFQRETTSGNDYDDYDYNDTHTTTKG